MRRIFLTIITASFILLLPVQGVFAEIGGEDAQATALTQNPSQKNADQNVSLLVGRAKALIKRKMRLYNFHNVRVFGDDAVFFAFHKNNENIGFGWYRLNTKKRFSKAERFLSSSEFSLLFQTAFSPDGREAVVTSKTGEIFLIELPSLKKKSLGAFNAANGNPRYSYPTYTPDGKYIVFHSQSQSSLFIVDAETKDFTNGTQVSGFWLPGIGGGETEKGEEISAYGFSEDGRFVTFVERQVLDLQTFTKQ